MIEPWSTSLYQALQNVLKDSRYSAYQQIVDGVDRHGAFEWTFHREDRTENLHRILSAFVALPGVGDGSDLPNVEVRGYACDEQGRSTRYVSEMAKSDDEEIIQRLIETVISRAEKLGPQDVLDKTQ